MTDKVGTVIAGHGRHYMVKGEGCALFQCVTRGKKNDVAVGDNIIFRQTSTNQGVIETILPRKTFLYRSDQYRSKLLAANITQVWIVLAAAPYFSEDFLSRSLVAAEAAGVAVRILLNKTDLVLEAQEAQIRLHPYRTMGYPIHAISTQVNAHETDAMLTPLLRHQSTLLIGQSGMGKSSLINLLVPNTHIATREISKALQTGRHTTTFVCAHYLDEASMLIDSPGFVEFGLHHLTEGMLERAFVEFRPYLGACKFYNCHHHSEPGCAILDAVAAGHICAARHETYQQLCHEAAQTAGKSC